VTPPSQPVGTPFRTSAIFGAANYQGCVILKKRIRTVDHKNIVKIRKSSSLVTANCESSLPRQEIVAQRP
jgi:hypothetical protein